MAPKRRTEGEERKRKEDREKERLEEELVRVTRMKKEKEGRRDYWAGEVEREGRDMARTRALKARQAVLVGEQKEAVSRAKRALEISEATAKRIQRELAYRERRLKSNEEALEQARVVAEVSTVLDLCSSQD